MRRFANERVASLMSRLGVEDDMPIEHNLISKSIESAQTKVEGHNFDIRKHVVEYDDVMNRQREIIYARRRKILEGDNMREQMLEMIASQIEMIVDVNWPVDRGAEPDREEILAAYLAIVPQSELQLESIANLGREDLIDLLITDADERYAEREEELGPDLMRKIERALMLNVIDTLWRQNLTQMDDMRQGIGLQAYAQRDPLVAYKTEGFEMFQQLTRNIEYDIVHKIYTLNVERRPVQRMTRPVMRNAPGSETKQSARPRGSDNKKIGRNDPCWCGSGKKFKHCHGRPELSRAGG